MIIGIISRSNLDDKVYWSGTTHFIYTKLKSYKNVEIVRIDGLNNTIRKISAFKREYLKFFKKIKYDETYNKMVAKNFAKQISLKLEKQKIDFLLVFDSSLISYLNTKIPIILWTDLLYSDYYNHYFHNEKILKETKKSIKALEKRAISNCFRIFLSSKWALNKAKIKYKNMSSKFRLLNIGPNLRQNLNQKKINKFIEKRSKKKLSLITLSVHWKRKGLDKLIKLNKILIKKGVESKLTIIGLKKKINDNNIKVINFINKNSHKGEDKISRHLIKNHFHLLFSNSEAYGISLVEANSRGLPNISFEVGGISHIVKNNINGKLFKKEDNLELIANYIIKKFKNNKEYKKLAKNSYKNYRKKFSYDKIIPELLRHLKNN
tara:strand:- start:2060 stop:3193 length:1134 start_codon:yes stop_codon:yes gene_type:complete